MKFFLRRLSFLSLSLPLCKNFVAEATQPVTFQTETSELETRNRGGNSSKGSKSKPPTPPSNCPSYCSAIQCGLNSLCDKCTFCMDPEPLCDSYCSVVQCGYNPLCKGCEYCQIDGPCDENFCLIPLPWMPEIKVANWTKCNNDICTGCEGCQLTEIPKCDSYCNSYMCGFDGFMANPYCNDCPFCKELEDPEECAQHCSQFYCSAEECEGCSFCENGKTTLPLCDSFCLAGLKLPQCSGCDWTPELPFCDSWCDRVTCNFEPDNPFTPCGGCDFCKK